MERIADVMAVIGAELPSHHVPGLALALIHGGQVVGVAGSGERIAGGDPVSADTAFEAASQHDADGSFAWRSSDRRRALGWAVASKGHGEILWQHGDNPGYKHLAAFNPGTGDAVVVMTNGDCGRELAVRVVAQIPGPSRIWTSATEREATA